ncbi:hypothetical protein BDF20DRAFT_267509 [Mycotypha africana]|uniref:uncharacterized protein n=1 Tax=Mycotypha africana TaxID=64632 RepID=UPI0023010AB7|nr:uncharacterized protein BDF20DRAFT_267509 [Mycotypha africana]KAI8987480.1 hypothetical protein BDF20DRAFT_267509 [Mycotypha africana]
MLFNYSVETRYLEPNPYSRKFCGCMSLRGGSAIACAVWIGVNTYIATLCFQGYTPIFSYLNKAALITFGSLSIVFALVAIYVLYGLFVDTPLRLQSAVVLLMLIVPIYLIDILVNIFIFGIQKQLYMDWCYGYSKDHVDEKIQGTSINGTLHTIDFMPSTLNIYNCEKLWEDEVKFSVAIFVVMSICYLYWWTCLFHYHEKLHELFPDTPGFFNSGLMNYLYAPTRMLPQYSFRNV